MGLFGTKERCPVCGGKVPGVFRIKIKDGKILCGNCARKMYMDSSMWKFQSADDIKEHLKYRDQNSLLFTSFQATQEIKGGGFVFRIDRNKQLWYISSKTEMEIKTPPVFRFDEIVDYSFSENGTIVTKGGLGSAVAGGLLFGGVGAIVGGITASKRGKTDINSMTVRISLNNDYITQREIELLPGIANCTKGGFTYKETKKEADSILSILDSMCSIASLAMSNSQCNMPSSADEIKKYKELLDIGAITKEEFDAKKKQLLDISR